MQPTEVPKLILRTWKDAEARGCGSVAFAGGCIGVAAMLLLRAGIKKGDAMQLMGKAIEISAGLNESDVER